MSLKNFKDWSKDPSLTTKSDGPVRKNPIERTFGDPYEDSLRFFKESAEFYKNAADVFADTLLAYESALPKPFLGKKHKPKPGNESSKPVKKISKKP